MSDHVTFTGTDPNGTGFLLTCWTDGTIEVATRPDPGATWSPPVRLVAESVAHLVGSA